MTIDVPFKLWVERKGGETGLTREELIERLRAGGFNGERPVANTRSIVSVTMECNRAKAIVWIAAKIQFKMDAHQCGCGNYGYRQDNDHTYVCADCEKKDGVYRRSLDASAERLQSKLREESFFFDNTVDVETELADAVRER
jgi:hypothetical protein